MQKVYVNLLSKLAEEAALFHVLCTEILGVIFLLHPCFFNDVM
jgi:hypothetical protein